MKTPILFIAFNRPTETARVFAAIRAVRPEHLYMAVDGPRFGNTDDVSRSAQVRALAQTIDWPCQLHTRFQEKNLGCKMAVSSAISWFFGEVEEGIVLEDDCLPHPSFFSYCEELLAKYRTDKRVMMISGFNAAGTWPVHDHASYFASKHTAIWGWASWRRAWQHYDVSMSSWQQPESKERVRIALHDNTLWKIKQWTYDSVAAGRKDTWDYQWEYALLLNGGLSITPTQNLIENIGFGNQGTHTSNAAGTHTPPPAAGIATPLTHPQSLSINEPYDAFFSRRWCWHGSLIGRILARIKKWTS